MELPTITRILELGNVIFASANVIIGFSLFLYILTHNLRSSVARAFCAFTAFVTTVYLVDVIASEVDSVEAANLWLRAQWLGIAFVPAAFLHFSDSLLRTTGAISRLRRSFVLASYILGVVILFGAIFTNLIVDGVGRKGPIYHLTAGPLFWAFAIYYVLASVIGWLTVNQARARCLTSTSRRRMSYLMLATIAPGLGVFPFLLLPTTGQYFSVNLISLVALVGNMGVALMTMVIGYTVAYQGVLLPDRVVKHSLLHFLLRGPLVGICVIVLMLVIPPVEQILGLPRDTVLIVAVAGSVVVLELLINLAKSGIDRLIYRRDRREIEWIQTLDQRLLTTTDLEQLLENTLIALCDLLRLESGFIVTMQGTSLALRVFCGQREAAESFLAGAALGDLLKALSKSRQDSVITNDDLMLADGHWLLPLRSCSDKETLGVLGLAAGQLPPRFEEQDLDEMYALVRRAETALEDMRLQQQVFAVLHRLSSELDQIQEWRSIAPHLGEMAQSFPGSRPLQWDGFVQSVKEALGQFWGGPKLSQSPLLQMTVVRSRLTEQDNVPAKAVRAALQEAIARLRPSGERNMMSGEWVMYNILDLKFVQGQRIRDIAQRLAISESDYYRKQRIAIEQVAQTLVQMEQDAEKRSAAAHDTQAT
jgi:hypothetical protein